MMEDLGARIAAVDDIVSEAEERPVVFYELDGTDPNAPWIYELTYEWSVDTANDPQRLLTLPGAEETVVSFNTDVAYLEHFGRKLLMGPGSILVAHGPEERVSKAELRGAVDLYRRTVLHLLAQSG